ncbi:hypothetical protein SOVF_012990 isoform A [Spinacia oleracea]|nr:hypothetical protein SOVF_012990 isoform A [Spinacia oleracea]
MVPVFFHSQCAHFAPVDHVPLQIFLVNQLPLYQCH